MVRDKLRDQAYFEEAVSFRLECIEEDIAELESKDSLTTEIKMKYAHALTGDLVRLMHERYTRGDSLAVFKDHLDMALEYRGWQKHYADALPAKEQQDRIQWEELIEDGLEETLNWLALAYCLDMGQKYYQQVFELIANQGQDALFDKVAVKMGDSNRDVSESLLFNKRFKKLYAVIETESEQRPKLMLAYLNAWYKLYGSPDSHLLDNDAYSGYWCWEAALIVKLYDIDDNSFIDHEYYPKDLVHWQSGK